MRRLLLVSLLCLPFLAGSAFADESQHVVAPDALAAATVQHAAQQDADRAAIRAALARPEVRQLAEKAGLDINRANAVVDTLEGPGLDRAASIANQVNEQLSGGASTIVISTTTIIIILLIVLLIVVAAK